MQRWAAILSIKSVRMKVTVVVLIFDLSPPGAMVDWSSG